MRRQRGGDDQDNGWNEWGGYMHAKIQKLQNQYEIEAPNLVGNEKTTKIFEGVAIYVNGLTDPSADELRHLMAIHGGIYHHYYNKHTTTHIIASNLANVKIKNISKNEKLVLPKWITDSIAAKKQLPYHQYLLYSPAYNKQKTINFNTDIETEPAQSKQATIDAKDSRFISEFYNHSRLHLISTLASELKRHVATLNNNSDWSFRGLEKIKSQLDVPKGNNNISESVIMHVDMDCFFVSVGLRKRPDLIGKPVAVTHSRGGGSSKKNSEIRKYEKEYYRQKRMINSKHTITKEFAQQNNTDQDEFNVPTEDSDQFMSCSEVASCSYEARKCGVRNGMFLGEAKLLCPNLNLIPYDFDGYREVAYDLYNTVASYTLNIEAVSCDELYVDCTELINDLQITPLTFAEILRNEVKVKTGCPCSMGLASNMLLARLATKKAKPNGQYFLANDEIMSFMAELAVGDIPGVGWSLSSRLKTLGVELCSDLQTISLLTLQSEFGVKTGQTLYEMCRGVDGRQINHDQIRKSVSAEVNYGIRFTKVEEANKFLRELSEEVAKRLLEVEKVGKTITLKLKVRKKGAPTESSKFLGHGICDSLSKSTTLKSATNDPKLIAHQVQNLLLSFKVRVLDLRGIGIQIQRLQAVDTNSKNLLTFLYQNKTDKSKTTHNREKKTVKQVPSLPAEVDLAVLAELPEELRFEICNEYKEQGFDLLPHQSQNNAELKSSNSDNAIESTISNNDDDKYRNEKEEISLCGAIDLSDVKQLISEWITTCPSPGVEDTGTISVYLKELVIDKNLERVYIVMKFLQRLIFKSNNEEWKSAFQTILAEVQSFIISMYGAPLKL